MLETRRQSSDTGLGARERILDASYELFSQRGIRGVGINEVIEGAGVATATLYRHFPSRDRLVLAFLEMREQRWTHGLVEAEAQHPAGDASVEYLDHIRSIVRRFADEAGLRDTESFARSWHILMKGSIVSAAEGDVDAARRAKAMARLLIDEYR
jgi:AcrR family transcriptional regulator